MNKQLILALFLIVQGVLLHAQLAWQPTQGPEGGMVYDFRRKDSSTIYAGTGSGLWQTTNNGGTWTRSDVVPANEACISVFVDGENIVLLTFRKQGPFDNPAFVYQSSNGGATWQKNNFDYDIETALNWGRVRIIRSGDALWCYNGLNDVLKSIDNGVSWLPLPMTNEMQTDNIQAVAISGNKLLLYGVLNYYRTADGGANWEQFKHDTLFIKSMFFDGDVLLRQSVDSLFRSDDFGVTWQGLPANTFVGNLEDVFRTANGQFAMFTNRLRVSNNGLIWATLTSGNSAPVNIGIDIGNDFLAGGPNGFFRTVQNNTAFEKASDGFLSTTIYAVAATPLGRLVAGTPNGTFISTDEGENWTTLNPVQPFPRAVGMIHMTVRENDVWGVGDNDSLYVLRAGASNWVKSTTADASFLGESFVRAFGNELFLLEDNRIRRSFDDGNSWQTIIADNIDDGYRDIIRMGGNLFYVNNDGTVFRSINDGNAWSKVHESWSPGTHRKHTLQVIENRLFHFKEDKGYYSDDLGENWQEIILNGLPTDEWGDPNLYFYQFKVINGRMWALINNEGVYFSGDQGNNWTAFNQGLLNTRGFALANRDNTLFYGGAQTGVWKIDAASVSTKNPALPPVHLTIMPNPAHQSATIQVSETGAEKLSVFDQYGREIWSTVKPVGAIQVSVADWPAGLYTVRLIDRHRAGVAIEQLMVR